jgi:hypothetical protein
MQLMSEKYTREQLEKRLELSGKEATAWIKGAVEAGALQYQLSPVDPIHSEKYQRTYFFVARTVGIDEAMATA